MQKGNQILIVLFLTLLVLIGVAFLWRKNSAVPNYKNVHFWQLQSVDTVKYSRDVARQYIDDQNYDKTIDLQVKAIADSGATHVAIGTPYDKEFIPFLTRWVNSARKYGLNVWFRGNFSGWEEWFDYKPVTRDTHKAMLKQFILDNGNLFKDGDIFTSCTECENGGPGDPRHTGDTAGHREFLIDEYQIGRNTFAQIGKNVATNYFPMNADVAKLIMNPTTTKALGGLVVVDHYVPTPQGLNKGVTDLAESSGGKVILGEFGAPIPDLQGPMTDQEQSDWIKQSLVLLAKNTNLVGINYWTAFGGSTRLWHEDGSKTPAVSVLTSFYKPKSLHGIVIDEAGHPIVGATLSGIEQSVLTDSNGYFSIPFLATEIEVAVTASGYKPSAITNIQNNVAITAILKKESESRVFKLQKLLHQNLGI